jgi:hypothetical protein
MTEEIDWSLTTYAGNRRRQHADFHALSFREKLRRIEQMEAVADYFSARRPAQGKRKLMRAAGEVGG